MPSRSFRLSLVASFIIAAVFSSFALANNTPKERTQQPKTTPAMPFEPTEQLVYEGEFSKFLLRGIEIAELRFSASRPQGIAPAGEGDSSDHNKAPYQLVSDVESKGWFQKLFGIHFRYHVESTVAPGAFSVVRTNKVDEQGKRVRLSEAVFDYGEKKVEWTERDPNNTGQPPRVVSAALEGPTHDIISAIYFLRTQTLAPGRTFELSVSDSGRIYRVPATVVSEKKKMKSVLGKVSVVRLDLDIFGEGRPVEGKGKMSLWITNDERRIPVKARLSHDMGQLDITLKSIKRSSNR